MVGGLLSGRHGRGAGMVLLLAEHSVTTSVQVRTCASTEQNTSNSGRRNSLQTPFSPSRGRGVQGLGRHWHDPAFCKVCPGDNCAFELFVSPSVGTVLALLVSYEGERNNALVGAITGVVFHHFQCLYCCPRKGRGATLTDPSRTHP